MCDRDQSSGLDLIGCSKKLVKGLGHAGNARFFQHIRVSPNPINAVHVDRHSHIVAFVFHAVGDHFGQQRVPVFGFGSRVKIGQHAFASPLLNRRAFDLCGRWRIAGNNAAF